MWYLPCGEGQAEEIEASSLDEEITGNVQNLTIENLKLQHRQTMYDYLNWDYEYLYEDVRIGVEEYQYIPNWVPGKEDVNKIKKLANTNSQAVSVSLAIFIFSQAFHQEHRTYFWYVFVF